MRYPANYGFVPHTLSPDGDPLDALVVARSPFVPGCVVRVRPIAVLKLEDEAGGDEKLLTVPVDSTFPYYSKVDEKDHLPEIVMQQIEHFFTHYKDLEAKKWVRIGTWGNAAEARQIGRATSELQSLMRISYAVFCLKTKRAHIIKHYSNNNTQP